MLFWIIFFCLVGSVGGVVAAASVLVLREELRKSLLPLLLSYATSTLLGAAFLGLLPESLERAAPMAVSTTILAGILQRLIFDIPFSIDIPFLRKAYRL